MPLRPNSSAQPLFGSKRSRDVPAPSHSVDSSTATPLSKKVRMNDIEIQTTETNETLENRDKDCREFRAKFDEYGRKPRFATNGRESTTSYRSLSRRRRSNI